MTKTSEKITLKEAAFAGNDKEMIIVVSEAYLTAYLQKHKKCYLNYTRIVLKSSSTAESKTEDNCLGNRDYDSVLSLIDNDVFVCQ